MPESPLREAERFSAFKSPSGDHNTGAPHKGRVAVGEASLPAVLSDGHLTCALGAFCATAFFTCCILQSTTRELTLGMKHGPVREVSLRTDGSGRIDGLISKAFDAPSPGKERRRVAAA